MVISHCNYVFQKRYGKTFYQVSVICKMYIEWLSHWNVSDT